jgi:glycosyltransferase involved in cell wall biosynthesis
MQIAFVHPGYADGAGTGATHSASRIVSAVAARGHEVTVYARDQPPESDAFDGDVAIESLDCDGFPSHTGLALDRELRARREEFGQYDLVHSYVVTAVPALAAIGAETTASTVVTLNAYGGICPKDDLRYMDREPCTSNGLAKCSACSVATSRGHDEYSAAYRAASRLGSLRLVRKGERVADQVDGYHALSPHIRDTYADFGFPRDRICVVPNLLDERFCLAHQSDFEPPYELLSVGTLGRHKGVDLLPPLLDRLQTELEAAVRLTVVGDGGLRSELEAETESRGLKSAVTFTGWVPNEDLPETFAAHDAFLYPGQWDEPFGRVFLEALATGTPVITSDVGSVAAIVGEGGRTTDGSVSGFVETISDVVANDGLRAMSRAATARAERYRTDEVAPQLLSLYEDALSR